MRFVLGLLLACICVPSGGATDRTAYLTSLAGVPIHVFDLQAANVSQNFREFLSSVPMTNNRPVPRALVDDTVASLAFLKAGTPFDEPAYFVATYIQKTPLIAAPHSARTRYRQRYGEEVYPQQVCPVFLSRANASVPRLLGAAVNLPTEWFRDVSGTAENYDRLFALTEASHCGFIARELVHPTVLPAGLGKKQVRTLLEALGDYEATVVFRGGPDNPSHADEAEVLLASRLLATFLLDRVNAYTPIPGLVHEYRRLGVDEAHRQLERITASVRLARRTVRSALESQLSQNADRSLTAIRLALRQARIDGRLAVDDVLAATLIESLDPAIRLVEGDLSARVFPGDARPGAPGRDALPLVTLIGASRP